MSSKCKTCNDRLYILGDGLMSEKYGKVYKDCPDCTKLKLLSKHDQFLEELGVLCKKYQTAIHLECGVCRIKKSLDEKDLAPISRAEQCKAKIDALLQEFGANLAVRTRIDGVTLGLFVGDSSDWQQCTLAATNNCNLEYNGKTGVSE